MDGEVSWVIEVEVKAGRLEAFRALVDELVESTRKEPGTLAYSWFIGDDGKTVHVYERYADSAATLLHVATFGERFAERFLELATPGRFHIYGTPSDAVREASAGLNPVYLGPLAGFAR